MPFSTPWATTRWHGWRRGWVPWLVDGLLGLVCAAAIAGSPAGWRHAPVPASVGSAPMAAAVPLVTEPVAWPRIDRQPTSLGDPGDE